MWLSDYHYPYVILISKLLHHFEVNLEEDLSAVVKSSHEVNNGYLRKMGFTKIGGKWVSKDGDQVGSLSGIHAEDDEGEPAATGYHAEEGNAGPGGAYDTGPAGNMGERITSMSPFERLMLSRMDNFADEQRSHHELCVARFQNLEEQIEVVQNQLFELQYDKKE